MPASESESEMPSPVPTSAPAVAPPQLDEFLMPSDAGFRVADMAALGWSEAEVYGTA